MITCAVMRNKTTPAPIFIFFVIFAIALIARFRYLDEIEHNVDHAYTVWQAMQTIDHGQFPLAGQGTSVLFANPPLTGYLLIPVVALTRSPLGVYVFIIALNTLAVWMVYRAARGLLNEAAGLIAAALMAVNPWVIEYSRTSWVQSLLPFFVSAVAWLLWPVLTGKTPRPTRRLILALVMTALLTQTYLLAYFILAPVVLLLVIFRKRIPARGAMIGGAVILVFSLLYGIGLLNQWETVSQRIQDFTTSENTSRLSTEAWDAAVRLITGSEYELARGQEAPADDLNLRHDLSEPVHYVLLTLLLIGMGAAVFALVHKTARRDAAIIVLVWFGLPIIAMSYTGNPVHAFYQLLGIPAGYVLTAWGLSLLLHPQTSRPGQVALAVLFVPFAALMLTNSARYYQETAAIPGAHDLYALPVKDGMALGDLIDANLPEGGTVFAQAEAWITNSFTGRLFSSIADTRAPRFYIIPRNGGVYIGEAPELATHTDALTLADGTTFPISALPRADSVTIPGTPLNIPSQQGLTLVSYDLTQIDPQTASLLTVWRVDAIAPEVLEHIYAPFLHVYNGDERLLNINGEGLPGYQWSVGDLHIQQMTFTMPETYTRLLVGQYDGLHNANIIFLPPDADPTVAIELN